MSACDFRPLFIALLFGVSVSANSQTKLPEGAGREIVQNKCAGCHELGGVLRSGYSAQDDWGTVVHMMNNVGGTMAPNPAGGPATRASGVSAVRAGGAGALALALLGAGWLSWRT
jgi:virginiamycin B lyase